MEKNSKPLSRRTELLREVLGRAETSKRRVFGYSSETPGCEQLPYRKRGSENWILLVPAHWNRICVEGDTHWTYLPLDEDDEPTG